MVVPLILVCLATTCITPPLTGPEERAAAIEGLGSDDKSRVTKSLFYTLDADDPEDRKALEAALNSTSYQRRQLAMTMLCSDNVKPSARLLEVCLEGLSDDAIPIDITKPMADRYMPPVGNARAATDFLVRHANLVASQLEKGLKEGDWQKKLLCACISGRAHLTTLLPLAAPILIEHLRDNDTRGDANTAIRGLTGFGKEVLSHLDQITNPDSQQRLAVKMTRWHLDDAKDLGEEIAKLPKDEKVVADLLLDGFHDTGTALLWKLKDFDELKYVYRAEKNAEPTKATPRLDKPADPPRDAKEKDRTR